MKAAGHPTSSNVSARSENDIAIKGGELMSPFLMAIGTQVKPEKLSGCKHPDNVRS